MRVDRNEVQRIAGLAHLELDDDAVTKMAEEMSKILSYIDQLEAVPLDALEDAPPLTATTLRPDEPVVFGEQRQIAANAPAWRDGYFVVPRVLGGE